ncbi:hypothetical protein DOM21_07105 [Bacteriovorax stolpii]|uniref:Uncharacterized protein n=1 Tax=Bacteriovorax stolpii TaxID=960 RepID=A0A2K9NTC4_BACTC|nr:hypothetical protein [Bacteriovorax stolpii]AUN98776.1 hypothetical protein C0V70_11830 [Bacteriovorax stolpii]QDK41227.1 hypothetical protein DOM21_07105 [Bacteriovorax stolpii]TDP55706.1 hypothetical protein C8D79_0761 [Bacteriovorax stolpii]
MKKYWFILLILLGQVAHASVDKVDYLRITKALDSIYAERIQEEGGELKFILSEKPAAPNAYAAKKAENSWEITVVSSFLSLDHQTVPTLGMILCHEVGHFLGGKPYVVGKQMTPAVRAWAPKKMSAEGQADYFATSECIKKLAVKIPDLFIKNKGLLNLPSAQECHRSYTNMDDIKLCNEILTASHQTILVYQQILEQLNIPSSFFAKTENAASDRTLDLVGEYPELDCRYETFIKGTLCSSLNVNECDDLKWSRPACWFHLD